MRRRRFLKMTPGILLSDAMRAQEPTAWIDHIVLGVARLDQGVDSFRSRTGITPEFGGEHPDGGTHNALASLGEGTYLEIIAQRPGAELHENWRGLAELHQLSPLTWAVGVSDIDRALADLRTAGFECTPPADGSRRTPGGSLLKWKTSLILEPKVEPAPFLIEWGQGVPHPSATAPGGCRMTAFALETRDVERLSRLVAALGLDIETKPGPGARMTVSLECPSGPAAFDSRSAAL